ncbi:MAG: DUF3459 domain-containing protein [Planctomycetota bacterium]
MQTNHELLDYYRLLIALRKTRPELVLAPVDYIHTDDTTMTLAYRRASQNRATIAAFNLSNKPQTLTLPRGLAAPHRVLIESHPGCLTDLQITATQIRGVLAPLSAVVIGTP